MTEQPHQSVADAITDAAQVNDERPDAEPDTTPMNDDDELVEPGTGDPTRHKAAPPKP